MREGEGMLELPEDRIITSLQQVRVKLVDAICEIDEQVDRIEKRKHGR